MHLVIDLKRSQQLPISGAKQIVVNTQNLVTYRGQVSAALLGRTVIQLDLGEEGVEGLEKASQVAVEKGPVVLLVGEQILDQLLLGLGTDALWLVLNRRRFVVHVERDSGAARRQRSRQVSVVQGRVTP